jgi:excisionase family DNA binding protein
MNKEQFNTKPDTIFGKIEKIESLKKEAAQSNFNKIILLTPKEVCELLHISARTCQSYRDQRILAFIQVGRKIYFRVEDIIAYLDQHHIKSDSWRKGYE